MKSWKAWALVLAIFCAGAVAGAFGMRSYMARHLPEMLQRSRQRLEEVFLENIDREVGLSAEQRAKILPILGEAVQRGDAIHNSVRAKMDAVMDECDARIAQELDEGQKAKFKTFRDRMAEMRKHGPPPGMPPGPPPGMSPGPPPGKP